MNIVNLKLTFKLFLLTLFLLLLISSFAMHLYINSFILSLSIFLYFSLKIASIYKILIIGLIVDAVLGYQFGLTNIAFLLLIFVDILISKFLSINKNELFLYHLLLLLVGSIIYSWLILGQDFFTLHLIINFFTSAIYFILLNRYATR